ncbi:hypothetical protein RJ640_030430 [Escallonia rubra]|uniref:Cyclin-dependent kinase inhibitor n=1 Tax=Escallonia rubra TaxID=112253 RepID=A0AA88U199_9ASTE|nr:hypothetical protein RJ640_030430 [Escallonia rubra]
MGKYMRKCKGVGEVAVMEIGQVGGVRTRARTLAMAAKRRKVRSGELEFSPSLVQLRRRRRVVNTPQNPVSPATSRNSSPSSDNIPASCCSSNGSTEVASERLKFADLEEIERSAFNFTCGGGERRDATPSTSELGEEESGELESTAGPSEACSRRRETAERTPSEAELEEFFSTAEKDLQKKFTEKYNYDIAKDVPLQGRYEWVRVKP